MTAVDYKALKKGGFMQQIQPDRFAMRLRVIGGQVTAEQLKKIYEVAQQYGQGYIHLTARQGIEIPFIRLEDIEAVKTELAKGHVQVGTCGPRVRTVTACQGNAICSYGLIDTTALAKEFDQQYCGREVPHKFKLGITGCRNNCLKAEENDLGVKGGMQPAWTAGACSFCGLCEAVCPTKAIQVQKQEKKLAFDPDKCVYCGKCVKSCPTAAWEGTSGYLLSFGGLFGNQIAIGQELLPRLFSHDELHKVVEKTLAFFKEHGKPGERFGKTLDRVGRGRLRQELEAIL
ncbi:4Fe-4S binding protein [Acetonema longum]|uniref:Nitrite and sulphite reductase 4Fe-4S region n=1 Tax=Acetonema longum DSM 6540 TaxID=1009370 RepID=F7NHD3_9FIRM|nr:4Fe-4S binding protein [Acetonema longum]EGO64616.1 nitrite and sulphite reductase 4Fe-4S region [Acetonema longum DSM 6540]